jgi:hypothetical protein
MVCRTRYGSVWITLSFAKKQRAEIVQWFRGFCRDWFWNAEVKRNREAFGYNRPRVIKGSTKTFEVSRMSFGKFEIREVR